MRETSPDREPFERREFIRVYGTILDERRDKQLKEADTRAELESARDEAIKDKNLLDFKQRQGGDD